MNKYNQNDFNKAISEHLKLTTILMQNEFGKISKIVNILMKAIKKIKVQFFGAVMGVP